MNVNKNLLNKVGFDRLEFNINFNDVDFSKYEHIKNTKMGTSSIDVSEYVDNKQFRYRLYNGRKNGEDILHLDVVLPRVFHDTNHNIYNVAAKNDTKTALNTVLSSIKAQGIDIPLKSLICTSMEINKTVLLEEDTSMYYDIFYYLLNGVCSINNQEGGLTAIKVVDKKRKKYKLYDKKEELHNTIKLQVEEELCRFEITLTGSESISRTFNTTNILDIRQAQLNKFYKKVVTELEEELEANVTRDSEELYNRFVEQNCKTLAELRETYQELDDEKRIIFREIVSNAVNKYRADYSKNSETVTKIIGSKSKHKKNNYKRAKKLLKKLKK